MRIFRLATLLSLLLSLGRPAASQEPAPTLADILSRWEQASRKIQCLDITFTRYEYDLSENTAEHETGRVYWEAAHQGFGKLDGGDQVCWDDGGVLWIQSGAKSYIRIPAWMPALVRLQDDQRNGSAGWNLFGWFFRGIQQAIIQAMEPPDELLLATSFDAAEFQARFDLKCDPQEDKIMLTVLPREQRDAERFSRVRVLIDARSLAPLGICKDSVSGKKVVTHVFRTAKINETPSDRNDLLWPDLRDLHDESTGAVGAR